MGTDTNFAPSRLWTLHKTTPPGGPGGHAEGAHPRRYAARGCAHPPRRTFAFAPRGAGHQAWSAPVPGGDATLEG